jgi:gliding motility-associated lipoprotein GldD
MKILSRLLTVCVLLTLIACDADEPVYSPKPRGYCRIDFPEKSYSLFDSTCSYAFEIPQYSQMNTPPAGEPCWFNLHFKRFNATIHLSYKKVNNDLAQHLENSHYFANKHQVKATGLEETVILRDSAKVYGLLFDISGNTASSLQFYLTDSTKHFLRGSLYFNSVPNIDSVQIVLDYLRKDVLHMINTFRWKN